MSIGRKLKALAAETGFGRFETVVVNEGKDQSMDGLNAVISGGTSGIGFAIAQRFVRSGCHVVLLGRNVEKGVEAERSLAQIASPRHVRFCACNVCSKDDIEAVFQELQMADESFKVNILVNSAGINTTDRFPDIDERTFDRVIETNVKGTLLLSQTVARKMIKDGVSGNILNVGSVSGFRPAWGPYEMSKWAIRGLTMGMADELIKYGIVVNSIAPGPTATPMTGYEDEQNLNLPWNPSGRMADPREIACIAQMLVTDTGRLIVGDTVCASGGAGVISLHR